MPSGPGVAQRRSARKIGGRIALAVSTFGISELIRRARRRQASTPDKERFRYQNLHSGDKKVRGNVVGMSEFQGFYEFGTLEKLDAEEMAGNLKFEQARNIFPYTEAPEKVHLSIDPSQLAKAWDLLLPELTAPNSPAKVFKITDLATAREHMKRTAMNQSPQDSKEYEEAKRVVEGTQITLYPFESLDEGKRDAYIQPFADLVKRLTSILDKNGIKPGTQPESDLPIDKYASYRPTKTDNPNLENRTNIDRRYMDEITYARALDEAKERPTYRALMAE
jgi:hypothetical protein